MSVTIDEGLMSKINELRGLVSLSAFMEMLIQNGLEEYKRITGET